MMRCVFHIPAISFSDLYESYIPVLWITTFWTHVAIKSIIGNQSMMRHRRDSHTAISFKSSFSLHSRFTTLYTHILFATIYLERVYPAVNKYLLIFLQFWHGKSRVSPILTLWYPLQIRAKFPQMREHW